MTIRTLLAALTAASTLLFFSPALAEDRKICGDASYFPSEYTCHNDKTLCATQFSLPTKPCGGSSGGCYPPEQFSCGEDGILRDLPEATSPFTLATWGVRSTFRNQTIKACGGYLAMGANARQCHACTAVGGTSCGSYRNASAAVFLPDGKMNSAVPGHQYWFVNPRNGLLQYTPALAGNVSTSWNTTVPNQEFAGVNVKVYENGFFVWDKEGSSSHIWSACLVTLPGGTVSTGRSWRIYAPISDIGLRDCEWVRIVATAVDRSAGVYKYA